MNYTLLKASISDWIARTDLTSAVIDDLIDLAEARINRRLRIRAMESVYFRALDSDSAAPVPSAYKQWKNAFLYKGTGTDDTFPSLANEVVSPLRFTQVSGAAQDFYESRADGLWLARIGTKFYVSGKPSGTYSLGGIIYVGFTALSSSAETNWLTDNAPDLLLAASLSEAAAYVKARDQLEYWTARFTAILADVQDESDRELWSGEQMVTRP